MAAAPATRRRSYSQPLDDRHAERLYERASKRLSTADYAGAAKDLRKVIWVQEAFAPARRDLDFSQVSDNLIVNGSAFKVHNRFTAVRKLDYSSAVCAGDCRICNLCKERRGLDIQVKYH